MLTMINFMSHYCHNEMWDHKEAEEMGSTLLSLVHCLSPCLLTVSDGWEERTDSQTCPLTSARTLRLLCAPPINR